MSHQFSVTIISWKTQNYSDNKEITNKASVKAYSYNFIQDLIRSTAWFGLIRRWIFQVILLLFFFDLVYFTTQVPDTKDPSTTQAIRV